MHAAMHGSIAVVAEEQEKDKYFSSLVEPLEGLWLSFTTPHMLIFVSTICLLLTVVSIQKMCQ